MEDLQLIIRKAFKYKLNPTPEQEQLLFQQAGCSRFVWNKMLALTKDRLERKDPIMWRFELQWLVTNIWKKSEEYSFLNESIAQSISHTILKFERALKDAFSRKSPKHFPRFKKRCSAQSFHIPQNFDVNSDSVRLPKIGYIDFKKTRELEGTVKNLTISFDQFHWYVSIQTEMEISSPVHSSKTEIGIDLGVVNFATLSDGTVIPSLSSFKKSSMKLKKRQQKLARMKKCSKNRLKQLKKVRRIHRKIANQRIDFLHKTSSAICKNHAVIVIEDLKVKNMSRSASGTIEAPGRNVKAKAGLNRSILDQGWGEFRRQLCYKSHWLGGKVIVVPAQYTSQRCSNCGNITRENRKTQAQFLCVGCGIEKNADLNAAMNILAAG